MEAIQKLIENGGWRPIEDATEKDLKKTMFIKLTNDNGKERIFKAIYISKHELTTDDWSWEDEDTADYDNETDTYYVPEGWFECIESDASASGWFMLSGKQRPTHFMPLDTPLDTPERMAEIIRAWVDKAQNVIIANGMGWDMEDVLEALEEALQQAEELAGKS
jgi:hypothetical protein